MEQKKINKKIFLFLFSSFLFLLMVLFIAYAGKGGGDGGDCYSEDSEDYAGCYPQGTTLDQLECNNPQSYYCSDGNDCDSGSDCCNYDNFGFYYDGTTGEANMDYCYGERTCRIEECEAWNATNCIAKKIESNIYPGNVSEREADENPENDIIQDDPIYPCTYKYYSVSYAFSYDYSFPVWDEPSCDEDYGAGIKDEPDEFKEACDCIIDVYWDQNYAGGECCGDDIESVDEDGFRKPLAQDNPDSSEGFCYNCKLSEKGNSPSSRSWDDGLASNKCCGDDTEEHPGTNGEIDDPDSSAFFCVGSSGTPYCPLGSNQGERDWDLRAPSGNKCCGDDVNLEVVITGISSGNYKLWVSDTEYEEFTVSGGEGRITIEEEYDGMAEETLIITDMSDNPVSGGIIETVSGGDCAFTSASKDIICYMDQSQQSPLWYFAQDNAGDILYVGCENYEYLSKGDSTWLKCTSWWEEAVTGGGGKHKYICFNESGQESIIECCGPSEGLCNFDVGDNANTEGGLGFSTGESVDHNNRYYCTEYFDWTTNLDEIYQGNELGKDEIGISCDKAKSPNGTLEGFDFTTKLCCGDDYSSDTYSDPAGDGDACYKGQVIHSCSQKLENGTSLKNIINKDGNLQGCAYSEGGIDGNPGVLESTHCGAICGKFCSYNESVWRDGETRNKSSTWPLPAGIQTECCEPTQCWNGTKCINDQSENPNSQPYSGYRCINGNWEEAVMKTTPDGAEGYCTDNSQCLYSLTGNQTCIESGNYVIGFYCENGNWTTRTKHLALKLLGLAYGDYSLFCGNYADVLNYYSYTASGTYIPDYLSGERVSGMCALSYNSKMIIGAALNQGIDADYSFLKAIGKSKDYCKDAKTADGEYHSCSGSDVWYNNKLNIVIFSKEQISLGPPASFEDFIKNPIQSIINWVMSYLHENPYDYGIVEKARFFDRLYASKGGSKKITAIMEAPTLGKDFILADYQGFSTDFCNLINEYSEKRNTDDGGNYYPYITCTKITNSQYYVATKDFGEQFVGQGIWKSEDIWKDLTSKLTIK